MSHSDVEVLFRDVVKKSIAMIQLIEIRAFATLRSTLISSWIVIYANFDTILYVWSLNMELKFERCYGSVMFLYEPGYRAFWLQITEGIALVGIYERQQWLIYLSTHYANCDDDIFVEARSWKLLFLLIAFYKRFKDSA